MCRSPFIIAAATRLSIEASPLGAHAVWFAQHAGRTALIYGHDTEDLDVVAR